MMNLQLLWELQELLKEEAKTQKELKSLPQASRLKILKNEIEAANVIMQEDKVIYDGMAKNIRSMERTIDPIKDKQKELNEKMYAGEITNAKELAGINQQVEQLALEINQEENKLIALMEERENFYVALKEQSKQTNLKKDEYRELLTIYNSQKKQLQDKINSCPAEKEAILAKLDQKLLNIYNDLQKKFAFDFIIKVKNDICGGCHMRISFDLQKHIKDIATLHYCDNCGRLIYADSNEQS